MPEHASACTMMLSHPPQQVLAFAAPDQLSHLMPGHVQGAERITLLAVQFKVIDLKRQFIV